MLIESLPKVSYIVPVYNHQDYVTQTLDSIVADSYSNKELVIINDGSTDCSHETIQSWIKANKHEIDILYKNRENEGISKTLNELISISSGAYIVPVASDDYLINNMTLSRIELLQKNPDKLMLINDAIVVNEKNELIYSSGNFEYYKGNKSNFTSEKGLMREIVRNWACVGPICIIDKKMYKEIGYYNPDLAIEDWDFYLRASSRKLIFFDDIKVAAYRIHSSNAHASLSKRVIMLKTIRKIALINMQYFSFPLNVILYYKYIKTNISILKSKIDMILSKRKNSKI